MKNNLAQYESASKFRLQPLHPRVALRRRIVRHPDIADVVSIGPALIPKMGVDCSEDDSVPGMRCVPGLERRRANPCASLVPTELRRMLDDADGMDGRASCNC